MFLVCMNPVTLLSSTDSDLDTCTLPWPCPLGFWCFYHWCFWSVWILSHCCPVQILTLTVVHYLDPIFRVFYVFITDVFGVYESCHTVVQYRFWPRHLYITLTLSSGFLMFLSLMFLVCTNPVTLLSSTDSDLDTCTLPWPCPLGFLCFYHWCFWCVWILSHCCPVWFWHLLLTPDNFQHQSDSTPVIISILNDCWLLVSSWLQYTTHETRYLFETLCPGGSKVQTRCVCETQMPQAATKYKLAILNIKITRSLILVSFERVY